MNEQEQRALAARVRDERKRRKLTLKELAAMAGVSENTVGNMERGTSFPQGANLTAILAILGITPVSDDVPPDDQRPGIDSTWSPDVRVALDVIGLYLEGFPPEEREAHIANIVRGIMARRL